MDAIAALAEQQYGLITRAQAIECGVSASAVARRVVSGHWVIVHPGVYRYAGTPVTARQRSFAATMWSSGVVSHNTAGRLMRLEAIRADGLHLTVGATKGLLHPDITIHRTTALPDVDKRFVDGIPCTSATRTLIDLAPALDDDAFEAAFESARRMGLTTLTWDDVTQRPRKSVERVALALAVSAA